ncbi:MAG: hypothetical protein KatS3mg090_0571 [Patescibacteria group bacterium]|nr:MAG: hypothetical protein KatS3mg090_0571 [Patescibacteria group bacterium]
MTNYTPIDINKLQEKFFLRAGSKESFLPAQSIEESADYGGKETKELDLENRVQVRQQEIKIDKSLFKYGLKPVKVEFEEGTENSLNFGVSDDKIWNGLHAPVNSSLRWFSELAVYILKKFNIKLKKVNGKVIRVMTG